MNRPNHIVEPEELMAYLDGELPAEQAIETAAHLEHCRECQKLAAELKEVSEMLVAWEVEEVGEALPDGIASELHNQIQEKPARFVEHRLPRLRFPTGRQVLWGSATAAVVLIIFAISMPSLLTVRMLSQRAAKAVRGRESTQYYESRPGEAARSSLKATKQVPSATPAPEKTGAIAGKIVAGGGRCTLGKLESGT